MAILFMLYIAIYVYLFLKISKTSGSYFNCFTTGLASSLLIRTIPFALNMDIYRNNLESVYVLLLIMYLSMLSSVAGYFAGKKTNLSRINIDPQYYSASRYGVYLFLSFVVMIVSFLILGSKGVGVREWIFNNRHAYIVGRKGNGLWYILYQLFILVSGVLILCIAKQKNKKPYLYIVVLIASYFTGSKRMMLSLAIVFLFFRDRFVKKVSCRQIVFFTISGVLVIIILLSIQSNMSLMEYSNYYAQFLKFITYVRSGKWEFGHGRILLEDVFWKLIPRGFFSEKPFIYGSLRVTSLFVSEASIISGNTPSFSEFVIPYADFGIVGVVVYFFFDGVAKGTLENIILNNINRDGVYFNTVFLYVILFICTPINFTLAYIVLFFVAFRIVQHFKIYIR